MTVNLTSTFLTGSESSSGSTNLSDVRDLVFSTIASAVVGRIGLKNGSGSGSRRHLAASNLSSFFTSKNSVLWILRTSMSARNNTELVLSTEVADTIARLNGKVNDEVSVRLCFLSSYDSSYLTFPAL